MSIRFIVIDNEPNAVAIAKAHLEHMGYSADQIWPPNFRVFSDWDEVSDVLSQFEGTNFDPKKNACVLMLDLALDTRNKSMKEGIAQVEALVHTILEPYVVLVHTMYPSAGGPGFHGVVDGVLNKMVLQDRDAAAARRSLRNAVGTAILRWESRTGRVAPVVATPQWRLVDSPAARRAEAGLGVALLSELVERVAEPWTDVRLDVLAGGYSGAYIVKIDGTEGGARASVVAKVARDPRVLEEELAAFRKVSHAYSLFQGLLSPMVDTSMQSLTSGGRAYFIVQSTVPGDTLEQRLKEVSSAAGGTSVSPEREFGPILTRLHQLAVASAESVRMSDDSSSLTFLPIDIERFNDSAETLSALRDQCVVRGYLADDTFHNGDSIRRFGDLVVGRWAERRSSAGLSILPVYDQHGDLNPRNVLVGGGKQMHLIDFARFGPWPAAYDFVRLELQLLLRLVDSESTVDSFGDRLREWVRLWGAVINGSDGEVELELERSIAASKICFRCSREVRVVGRKLGAIASDHGLAIEFERVVSLCRAFDAIKMCSYQDASLFKRLWFLLIAIESAIRAGLITEKELRPG